MSSKGKGIRAAARVRDIRYAVRDVVQLAKEIEATGREMFYLNIGDPNIFDFETPAHIRAAAEDAMERNRNGYADSDGVPEALDAIRAEAEGKGIRAIRHVWIGNGVSEVVDMALTALADPGENVLIPSPGYPLYSALLTKLGVEAREYFLDEESGWQPDPEDIAARIDERTRAVVVINPNNPTGSVASRETLQRIVDLAEEHGLVVFADEIYDRLLMDGERHVPLASLSETASVLTLGGLSKNHVAPGWRIGWGIMSGVQEVVAEYVSGIQQLGRTRLSANHPEQYAIKPALQGDQGHIAEMMARLTERRDLMLEILGGVEGISCVPPRGAFYAFPRLPDDVDDAEWARNLMKETGVVVVPGSGFGQSPGTRHFRIVLLPPLEILGEACRRIAAFTMSG